MHAAHVVVNITSESEWFYIVLLI